MRTQRIATATLLALSAVSMAAGAPTTQAVDERPSGDASQDAPSEPEHPVSQGVVPGAGDTLSGELHDRNVHDGHPAASPDTEPTSILPEVDLGDVLPAAVSRPMAGQVRATGTTTDRSHAETVQAGDGVPTRPRPATLDADGLRADALRNDALSADALGARAIALVEPARSLAAETMLVYTGNDGEEIDVDRLRTWLEGRDSPLAAYTEELIRAGLDHDVDPRLVVGIAAIESSVGIALPPGSHNAWGWGGNGAHGLAAWPSWPVAIDTFTERLGALYDTDNVDETMARRYCPPNWRQWLRTVRWVMQDI